MSAPIDDIEAAVPDMRRYARALVRDRDAADDLVQDTLARALGRRHLWKPTGTVRAWLFTILHNLSVNRNRKAARRPLETEFDDTTGMVSGSGPVQADRVYLRQVSQAIDRLSEDQRRVLLLVVVEELSYQEVADVLGVPIGTVMSRLARARTALKAIVDGENGPRLVRVK